MEACWIVGTTRGYLKSSSLQEFQTHTIRPGSEEEIDAKEVFIRGEFSEYSAPDARTHISRRPFLVSGQLA